jgi:pimeloyl-ACP methyl ester carboxylesterase
VFGHGLSCDRTLFDHQVRELSRRFRCVSLDWPGHGSRTTFDPDGWSLDDLAADTAALIEHLDAGPVVLIGLSQGGMVFLRVAIERADLVRGLVLLDTSARAEPAERVAAVKSNLAWLLEASDEERAAFMRESAIPAFFGQPWRDRHPDDVEQEVRRRVAHDRVGYDLAVRAVVDRRPIDLAQLAGLEMPVAVVVGELDTLTPVDHAEELTDSIAGAELSVIPDAGHHPPVECPELVTAAIDSFLRRLT